MSEPVAFSIAAPPLAYMDSLFAGLVPCRVIGGAVSEHWPGGPVSVELRVQFTAPRYGTSRHAPLYARGQIEAFGPRQIVPRRAVMRRKYGARILAYRWADLIPELARALETVKAGRNPETLSN